MSRYFICFLLVFISPKIWSTSHYALQMENNSNHETYITFLKDIGEVYLDIALEPNTLVSAHQISNTFGVNYAPNDPESRYQVIFRDNSNCIFTVNYFTPPEIPIVSIGSGCVKASYRVEYKPYAILILSIA